MARKKLTLSKERREHLRRHSPKKIKGRPLHYSAAAAERYKYRLDSLILQMTRTTRRNIEHLFKQPTARAYFEAHDASISSQSKILVSEMKRRFQQLFDRRASALAGSMVDDAQRTSAQSLQSSLNALTGGLTIKTSMITPGMRDIMKASIAENVSLIKSIPSQYFTQIEGEVMRSITSGNGLQDLLPAMQKYEGITLRRAQLISRDQTKKVYSNLNASRLKNIGMDKYEWQHSAGDVEPRPLHLEYSGRVFSLSDPPVIQYAKGSLPEVRGKPGDLINCTCIMIPIIEFDTGEENADDE